MVGPGPRARTPVCPPHPVHSLLIPLRLTWIRVSCGWNHDPAAESCLSRSPSKKHPLTLPPPFSLPLLRFCALPPVPSTAALADWRE
ncbi:hypothetical protein DPEC_G00063950 [Dallia pectoralis]|uniref:Uncharacterized protein n=1 Tax=Dallia pectoralis TaxID=75939 RepID=A0ACC2H8G2_DALPE|nr:hypothetical protein DPEC_G00063950 [Dallia pectoralis]